MTILITGGSGQLGQDFVKFYQQNSDINLLYPSHTDFDITNLISIQNYLQDKNIDIIINCAAYTAVDKAELDVTNCFELNTKAVENLINVCKKFNILLVQISTDYVFDGSTLTEYTEDSQTCPISIYGKSKAEAEQLILNSLTKYFIIRTSWLFGSNGATNFIKTMLDLFNKLGSIDVVSDEIGSPTFTQDLVRAVDALLETTDYGIYHIHNTGYISRFDFATEIARLVNSSIKINPITSVDYLAKNIKSVKATRPLNNRLAINKIAKYYTMPTWQTAVQAFLIEYYIKQIDFIKTNNIKSIIRVATKSIHYNFILDNKYIVKIFDNFSSEQLQYKMNLYKYLEEISSLHLPKLHTFNILFNNISYTIRDYILGIPFITFINTISKEELLSYGKSLGSMLWQIREVSNKLNIPTIQPSRITELVNWSKSVLSATNLTFNQLDLLFQDIDTYLQNNEHWPHSIINFDLSLYNLIVDTKGNLIIIDWEDNISYDLAYFDLKFLGVYPEIFKQGVLEAYFGNIITTNDLSLIKIVNSLNILITVTVQLVIGIPEEQILAWYNRLFAFYGQNYDLVKPTWLSNFTIPIQYKKN